MATRPSRETILEQFRACTRKLGRTPGSGTFSKIIGISSDHVLYYWPKHSAFAEEAGVQPNVFNAGASDVELFETMPGSASA